MTGGLLLQAVVSGLLLGGVYGLVASGLTLIFGVLRIVNFAHGAVMMLAMYTSYWLFAWRGVDPYLSVVLMAPLFFVLGMPWSSAAWYRCQRGARSSRASACSRTSSTGRTRGGRGPSARGASSVSSPSSRS